MENQGHDPFATLLGFYINCKDTEFNKLVHFPFIKHHSLLSGAVLIVILQEKIG